MKVLTKIIYSVSYSQTAVFPPLVVALVEECNMNEKNDSKRERLWFGPTVLIKIPRLAVERSYPAVNGVSGGKYLQFPRPVRGGVVNLFYHHEEPDSVRNELVIAEVEVWRKTATAGREFIYIDLKPTSADKWTHFLTVMPFKKDELVRGDDYRMFELPVSGGLTGTIIIAPTGSKVLLKDQLPVVGPELSRMIAQGGKVVHRSGARTA